MEILMATDGGKNLGVSMKGQRVPSIGARKL